MKKLVLIAILSLVPFTAFALDAMNDNALDQITAQEGVTITFDNVVINQAGMNIAWEDDDGIADKDTTGGYIFLAQSSGNLIKLDGTSLTIDVATATTPLVIGAGDDTVTIAADTTFIALGLPSVTIGAVKRSTTITLDDAKTLDEAAFPAPTAEALGTLYEDTQGNTTVTGRIFIYAHE